MRMPHDPSNAKVTTSSAHDLLDDDLMSVLAGSGHSEDSGCATSDGSGGRMALAAAAQGAQYQQLQRRHF